MTDEAKDGGPAFPPVIMVAKTPDAADLVMKCARGEIPFSGPDSLWSEFSERGWSHSCLYERVMDARALSARKGQDQ